MVERMDRPILKRRKIFFSFPIALAKLSVVILFLMNNSLAQEVDSVEQSGDVISLSFGGGAFNTDGIYNSNSIPVKFDNPRTISRSLNVGFREGSTTVMFYGHLHWLKGGWVISRSDQPEVKDSKPYFSEVGFKLILDILRPTHKLKIVPSLGWSAFCTSQNVLFYNISREAKKYTGNTQDDGYLLGITLKYPYPSRRRFTASYANYLFSKYRFQKFDFGVEFPSAKRASVISILFNFYLSKRINISEMKIEFTTYSIGRLIGA